MTATLVRQAIGRFSGSPLTQLASKIQAASLGSAPLPPDTTRRNSGDDIIPSQGALLASRLNDDTLLGVLPKREEHPLKPAPNTSPALAPREGCPQSSTRPGVSTKPAHGVSRLVNETLLRVSQSLLSFFDNLFLCLARRAASNLRGNHYP